MQPLQPVAPGGEHEDPLADAGQKASTYLSLAMAIAQRRIDARLGRAGDRGEPIDDALADAREKYNVILGKDKGSQASSEDAFNAWVAATPYRDTHRDARQASDRAKGRLQTLHPDAMTRYDQLRTGLDPFEAMSIVAPLIDADRARTDGRDAATAARAKYETMLGEDAGSQATSEQAQEAWTAAMPYAATDDTAAIAADRAENRLRQLHPEAMAHYDQLRTGLDSESAIVEVAQVLDQERGAHRGPDQRIPAQESVAPSATDQPTPAQEQATAPGPGPVHAVNHVGEAPAETTPSPNIAGSSTAQSAAAAQAADRATAAYAPRAGEPPWYQNPAQQYAPVIRQTLPAALAAEVLTDPTFPQLADTLDHARRYGANVPEILATAVHERELGSAKSAAQVLHYRLTHPVDGVDRTRPRPAVTVEADDVIEQASAANHAPPLRLAPPQPAAALTEPAVAAQASQQTPPAAAAPHRVATAADAVSASYPQPLRQIPVPASKSSTFDLDAAAATLALGQAELSKSHALRAVPDDPATPAIDEHHDTTATADTLNHVSNTDVDHAQSELAGAYPGAASFPQPLANTDLNKASAAATAASATPATASKQAPAQAAPAQRP